MKFNFIILLLIECEKNGKVYANGEKLVDPETPCTVCYCQGNFIYKIIIIRCKLHFKSTLIKSRC